MQSCVNKFKTQQVDQEEEIKTLINNYYLLIEYTKEKQKWLINNHHGFGFAIISILQLALLATLVIYFLYTLGMVNGHLYFWQTKLGDLLPKKLNINNASIIKTYFKKCNNVDGKEIFSDFNIKKVKGKSNKQKIVSEEKNNVDEFSNFEEANKYQSEINKNSTNEGIYGDIYNNGNNNINDSINFGNTGYNTGYNSGYNTLILCFSASCSNSYKRLYAINSLLSILFLILLMPSFISLFSCQ